MSAKSKKIIGYVIATTVIIAVLSFPICHLAKLPSPLAIMAIGGLQPRILGYRYMDRSDIAASSQPLRFEAQPQKIATNIKWAGGTSINIAQFQEKTRTHALLVLHKDQLVYEQYHHGASRETIFPSFSIAKSMQSALLGLALQDGKIKSLNDPIGNYVPGLAPDYAKIRVNDLLNMHSGIDVVERYDTVFAKIAYMYLTTDLKQFIADLQSSPVMPNAPFSYRSVDSLMLSLVVRNATGDTLTHGLEQKIWQPMGAEYAASWSVDSAEHKYEKTFCCVNARGIDFLKFGALYLHKGMLNGKRILPENWTRPRTPYAGSIPGFFYSDGWWLPSNTNEAGDFTAIGIHGQFVYVNPKTETVIVKLSDHGAEQDEALTVAAFQAIAADLARQ